MADVLNNPAQSIATGRCAGQGGSLRGCVHADGPADVCPPHDGPRCADHSDAARRSAAPRNACPSDIATPVTSPAITGAICGADLASRAVSAPSAAPPAPHGVSARARLVIALVLAFAIASVQGLTVMTLIAAIAAGGLFAAGSARHVMARMRGAFALALAFAIVMPLVAGQTPMAQVGPLTMYQEGAQAGALIGGRLLVIVALTLALLSTLPVFQLVAGLRGLGLPPLMADLALLTLRYLDEVSAQLARARLARYLRGGRGGWRALPDHALLLATGLIRAQARSEALWAAMRLRGYGAGLAAPVPPLSARDRSAMLCAGAVAVALVALDRSL